MSALLCSSSTLFKGTDLFCLTLFLSFSLFLSFKHGVRDGAWAVRAAPAPQHCSHGAITNLLINLKTSLWEIFRLYSLAKLSGLWKEISCWWWVTQFSVINFSASLARYLPIQYLFSIMIFYNSSADLDHFCAAPDPTLNFLLWKANYFF